MKRYLLSLFVLQASLCAFAQQVSVEEALSSAKSFLSGCTNNSKRKANSENRLALAYTAQADGKNHFYVFNENDADGGFVIVGGDEAAKEILGYCDHGNFDYATAPDNFKWWISQYSKQIAEGIKQGVSARNGAKKKAASNKSDIPMLIQTTWNQNYPYNSQIPNFFTYEVKPTALNRPATGCVSTAMAQVMYYYKYPTTGTGSATCSSRPNGLVFSANFGETTYEWDKMKTSYTGKEDIEEDEAVAIGTLLFHCGVSVDTSYKTLRTGSSASTSKVAQALTKYFNYDKSIQYVMRSSYSDQDWEQLMYNELASQRPVLYSGVYKTVAEDNTETSSGHAFVCDGYKSSSDEYHFNWGWGGLYDGYFAMTGTGALKPNGSSTGGGGDDAAYDQDQSAVIGIKPDAGGSYIYTTEWKDYGVTESSVERGATFKICGKVMNTSSVKLCADYGLGFKHDGIVEKVVPIVSEYSLEPRYESNTISLFDVKTYGVPEGSYSVRLMFREHGTEEWKESSMVGEEPTVEITRPSADYLVVTEPTIGNNGYATTDETQLLVSFVVKNYLETTLNKNLIFCAFPYEGGNSVLYFTKNVSIPAQSEQELTFSVNYKWKDLVSGNRYYIKVDDNVPLCIFYVVDNLPVNYNLTTAGWGTLILPYDQTIPTGVKAYTCDEINEDGELVLTEVEGRMEMCTPYIVSGDPSNLNFNGPDVPDLNSVYTKGLLTGVLGDYELKSNDYIMQKQNDLLAFFKVGDGTKLGTKATKNRCILSVPSDGYTSLKFPQVDASSVNHAVETLSLSEGIYTVGGMRVDKLQKGLNILRKSDGSVVKVFVK